jgi:subtilase family serine protease
MRDWLITRKWRSALIGSILALVLAGIVTLTFAPTAALAATACGGAITMTNRTTLPGHLIPALQGYSPLHDMACETVLSLTISLVPRDPAGLSQFLHDVYDPASPDYHHFLTTQEYADRFGQPQAAIDTLTAYLRQAGFTIDSIAPNRLALRVHATVAQIEQAFDVHLAEFAFFGRTVHAPLNEPSVPAALAATIQAIIGLSDVAVAHPPR